MTRPPITDDSYFGEPTRIINVSQNITDPTVSFADLLKQPARKIDPMPVARILSDHLINMTHHDRKVKSITVGEIRDMAEEITQQVEGQIK